MYTAEYTTEKREYSSPGSKAIGYLDREDVFRVAFHTPITESLHFTRTEDLDTFYTVHCYDPEIELTEKDRILPGSELMGLIDKYRKTSTRMNWHYERVCNSITRTPYAL